MTPSCSQDRVVWDNVSTRTSWPRSSRPRRRFFTEVTTPLTAGLYQSEVIKIFMTAPHFHRRMLSIRRGGRLFFTAVNFFSFICTNYNSTVNTACQYKSFVCQSPHKDIGPACPSCQGTLHDTPDTSKGKSHRSEWYLPFANSVLPAGSALLYLCTSVLAV